MALTDPSSNRPSSDDDVAAIKELQRLKCAVVAGTTSATNIAITGIATADQLVAVLQQDGTSGVIEANRLSEASITSAGNIQLATTNTTGKVLIVWYFDVA